MLPLYAFARSSAPSRTTNQNDGPRVAFTHPTPQHTNQCGEMPAAILAAAAVPPAAAPVARGCRVGVGGACGASIGGGGTTPAIALAGRPPPPMGVCSTVALGSPPAARPAGAPALRRAPPSSLRRAPPPSSAPSCAGDTGRPARSATPAACSAPRASIGGGCGKVSSPGCSLQRTAGQEGVALSDVGAARVRRCTRSGKEGQLLVLQPAGQRVGKHGGIASGRGAAPMGPGCGARRRRRPAHLSQLHRSRPRQLATRTSPDSHKPAPRHRTTCLFPHPPQRTCR